MDLFFEQLPIVLGALNTGFIQTLKLFFVTLLGAFPLGLLIAFGSMSKFKPLSYLMKIYRVDRSRHTSDDPDAYYLLFSGTCIP